MVGCSASDLGARPPRSRSGNRSSRITCETYLNAFSIPFVSIERKSGRNPPPRRPHCTRPARFSEKALKGEERVRRSCTHGRLHGGGRRGRGSARRAVFFSRFVDVHGVPAKAVQAIAYTVYSSLNPIGFYSGKGPFLGHRPGPRSSYVTERPTERQYPPPTPATPDPRRRTT